MEQVASRFYRFRFSVHIPPDSQIPARAGYLAPVFRSIPRQHKNGMRSANVSFKMPWPLKDRIEARARSLGYLNLSRYFTSLAIHDLIYSRPHRLTVEIANASPAEQDALIEGLIKIQQAKAGHLTWLEHRICEACAEALGTERIYEIEERLANRIRWQLVEDGMAA